MAVAYSYVFVSSPTSFEEAAVEAEMKETGPQMQAALEQYSDDALRVFVLYGQTPEFGDIMYRYGHNQVVPIVAKCLEKGDPFLEFGSELEQVMSALLDFEWPAVEALEPIECGWRAILLVQTVGNDFLGQFVINEEGKALRLPGSSIAAALKGLATSGLQRLERRLVLGETPTFGEWGLAVLDVAVIGVAGKSVAVLARGKLATRATLGARLTAARQGIAGFAKTVTPKVAGKVVKYSAVVGVGYLAIYHPAVITGAAGTIAEVLGLPPFLVQGVVWGVILYVPLSLLASLLYLVSRPFVWGRRAGRIVKRAIK